MKTIIKIIALMLMMLSVGISESVQAQSPEKMSYQAVIRDGSDDLITSSNVGIKIQILQGSVSGTTVYEETHTATTNANGLISIQVGAGNVVSGDFTNIDWGNGSYYIKNQIDPTGGNNYSITGTSELLSVPYALYAKTSDSPIPGPPGPPGNGIASTTDNGDGTITFTYDDGTTFTTSDLTGPQGPQGSDGNGIASTTDNGDGTFTFTYDDGSTFTTSDLTGPQGDGFDDGTAIGNTIFWDGNNWIENDLFYNDGNQIGIGNTNPEASFHVGGSSAENGILVTGTFGQGQDLNISGAGTRMFFYPKKAAFRAGKVDANQWDNSEIGDYSSAWGQNSIASGYRSTAWGFKTVASGIHTTAWGVDTEASASRSTAWGDGNVASGLLSTVWGVDTEASGNMSTSWGGISVASGNRSTAWGLNTLASASNSTAFGKNTVTSGDKSTAWGENSIASGDRSTAWGLDTEASADRSTAWGFNTEASGLLSTAWGGNTKASVARSTAWGFSTEASASNSTAFGKNTVASEEKSTAWGDNTEASGFQSTAFGKNTLASAFQSTAWGFNTEASADNSTAWGDHIKAKSFVETAIGYYNTDYTPNSTFTWNADDRLFGIGNGTSNANRSDAMVVLKNGKTGIGLSNPQFDLAVSVSGTATNNGEGIALVSPSENWNIDIDGFSDLAFNYNNNNVSYINHSTGDYVQLSDKRLKENIQPLSDNVLGKLQQINVVQYNYKRDKTKTQTTGVIAQEINELFPIFVHKQSKNGNMGVNYAGLSVIAIQGIQEQQKQIDKLESENKDQKEQIDKLKASNKALQEKVDRILKLMDKD